MKVEWTEPHQPKPEVPLSVGEWYVRKGIAYVLMDENEREPTKGRRLALFAFNGLMATEWVGWNEMKEMLREYTYRPDAKLVIEKEVPSC